MEVLLRGAFLATAAAGFLGCASSQPMQGDATHDGKMTGVMCSGINGCGGQGACGTADNSCKGQNACKGKGLTAVDSAEACTAQGGKVVAGHM